MPLSGTLERAAAAQYEFACMSGQLLVVRRPPNINPIIESLTFKEQPTAETFVCRLPKGRAFTYATALRGSI